MKEAKEAYQQLEEVASQAQRLASAIRTATTTEPTLTATPVPFRHEIILAGLEGIGQAKELLPLLRDKLAHAEAGLQALEQLIRAIEVPTATPSGASYNDVLPKDELSNRTRNALRVHGITTVRELCGCDLADLMKVRNFGKKCLTEVELYRQKLGVPISW